jgi:hypothetical protein
MPQLSVSAGVRAGVYVGGPASSYTAAPLFPRPIEALAGFPAGLMLHAAAGAGGARAGFTTGPAPAGMSFSTVAATGPGRAGMEVRWTPCAADAGTTAACFAAAAHRGAGAGGAVSSAMVCVGWAVAADPAPVFTSESAASANFTMGRAGSFAVYAEDANCQDAVTLAVVTPPSRNASGWAGGWGLPAGASVSAAAAYPAQLGSNCSNGRTVTVTWTPPNTFGGFAQVAPAPHPTPRRSTPPERGAWRTPRCCPPQCDRLPPPPPAPPPHAKRLGVCTFRRGGPGAGAGAGAGSCAGAATT